MDIDENEKPGLIIMEEFPGSAFYTGHRSPGKTRKE